MADDRQVDNYLEVSIRQHLFDNRQAHRQVRQADIQADGQVERQTNR